jgi:hypothetical protein
MHKGMKVVEIELDKELKTEIKQAASNIIEESIDSPQHAPTGLWNAGVVNLTVIEESIAADLDLWYGPDGDQLPDELSDLVFEACEEHEMGVMKRAQQLEEEILDEDTDPDELVSLKTELKLLRDRYRNIYDLTHEV